MNELLLVICICAYITSARLRLNSKQVNMALGFTLGALLLSLVPLIVLYLSGSIGAPSAGSGRISRIPAVDWERNRAEISVILMSLGTFVVLDIATMRPALWTRNKTFRIKGLPRITPRTIAIAYCAIGIVVFLLTGLAGSGHWARSRDAFFRNYGVGAELVSTGLSSLRLAYLACMMSAWMRGKRSMRTTIGSMAVFCVLDLYLTGNRIFTLQSLVAITVGWYVKGQFWALFAATGCAFPFGYLMMLFTVIRAKMHTYHGSGVGALLVGLQSGWEAATNFFRGSTWQNFFLQISEGSSVNVFVAVVNRYPRVHDHLMGATIIRPLVFWVPRTIWATKPPPISLIFGFDLLPGLDVSLSGTVFAEYYANLWLFGPIALVVVLRLFDASISKCGNDVISIRFLALVAGFTHLRLEGTSNILPVIGALLILNHCVPIEVASNSKTNMALTRVHLSDQVE